MRKLLIEETAGKLERVFRLEELSYTDVDKLDRDKSIFFLTFGNLEEHGPHLPLGTDYFSAIAMREGVISELHAAHPEHNFVVFPVLPVGEGGAGGFARQFEHIGDYMIRFETLRNLSIDLGATIARKGFQNIFVIHFHGAPLHNIAFSDAAAFVSETYDIQMVNITSLVFGGGFFNDEVLGKYLGEGWLEKYGITVHAGAAETSLDLYVRGDLVKPEYQELTPVVAKDLGEALRAYERPEWQGYWNAPSLASKEMGQELLDDLVDRSVRIAEKALAGEDLSVLPVYPDNMPPMAEAEDWITRLQAIYADQSSQIETWLEKRDAARAK
jgi:creatinine amidohydrolase/Fe(II)-dependent formamide hydrolase-like protein